MRTECIADSFGFEAVEGRAVVAAFDGGTITSDAGGLLLGATDRAIGVVDRLASCFVDQRSQAHVEHSVATLVGQRIFAIALGYEDLNDHETLRHDPLMAVLSGKLDARRADCAAVSGKSTLNRLELSKPEPSRYHKISYDAEAVDRLFVDLFLEAHRTAPSQITLDLDATDDPLHGEQEGRFFHGYYKSYCYLPLHIFCGRHLLCARLRKANIDASAGSVDEVARIVAQIRECWPKVRILLRADSGFTRDDLMTWCEQNDVDYLFGLAKNDRLITEIAAELAEAAAENRQSGKPARRFKDFQYRTHKSWSRQRRVVGKAEWMIPSAAESETKPRRKTKNKKSIMAGDIDLATLEGRANPRFVVTSLPADQHQARDPPRRCHMRHHPPEAVQDRRPGPHQRPQDQVLDGISVSLHRCLSNGMGRARRRGSLNPRPTGEPLPLMILRMPMANPPQRGKSRAQMTTVGSAGADLNARPGAVTQREKSGLAATSLFHPSPLVGTKAIRIVLHDNPLVDGYRTSHLAFGQGAGSLQSSSAAAISANVPCRVVSGRRYHRLLLPSTQGQPGPGVFRRPAS